jgi:hypothetical protein
MKNPPMNTSLKRTSGPGTATIASVRRPRELYHPPVSGLAGDKAVVFKQPTFAR